jgi:hypothetical protein
MELDDYYRKILVGSRDEVGRDILDIYFFHNVFSDERPLIIKSIKSSIVGDELIDLRVEVEVWIPKEVGDDGE